jgi:hypothetical protein
MKESLMSNALEHALASLDEEGLEPCVRHITDPRTGTLCAVEMAANLWRGLDDLARDCQTTSAALYRFARLEFPEADFADALWLFLRSVYVQPFQGEGRGLKAN